MDIPSPGQYVTLTALPPDYYAIYALIDPTDEQVYYVGQTRNPQVRLAAHLSDRHYESKKGDWLRRLEQTGQQPLMQILEVVIGQKTALEKEQEWIEHFLKQGMPLLNYQAQPERKQVRRPLRLDLAAEVDRVPWESFFNMIFRFQQENSAPPPKAPPGRRRRVRELLSALAKSIEELQTLEAECKELEAKYEETRREFCTRQQELYNEPLALDIDTDAEMPNIAKLEASWAEDNSLKTVARSVRLAASVRVIQGTPIMDTLAALAAHLQVEDALDLSESDWPAVLEWFADLVIE